MRANVDHASKILTGDRRPHQPLAAGYIDRQVVDHPAGEQAWRRLHEHHERAYGNMKTGMRGACEKVPPRPLQSYLDDCSGRHNGRRRREVEGVPPFEQLLARAAG